MPTSTAGGLIVLTGTNFGEHLVVIAIDKNLAEKTLDSFEQPGSYSGGGQVCASTPPGIGAMSFSVTVVNGENNTRSGEFPISYPKPKILGLDLQVTPAGTGDQPQDVPRMTSVAGQQREQQIILPSGGKANLTVIGENFGDPKSLNQVSVSIGTFQCRVLRMSKPHSELVVESPPGAVHVAFPLMKYCIL